MAEQDIPPPTITAMKIPIIRKGEYDIWSMRMRQYICHTDHNLWDVIVNGDLEEEPAPTTGETSAPPAPKTAKQLAARRNQERVKSILLLAIPDEYLLKFHNVADAKSLWEAIKSRFGDLLNSALLSVNLIIYTSCIQQFWATAKANTVNGGTDCLPTATIFEELARIGRKQRKDTTVTQENTQQDDSVPTPSNDPPLSEKAKDAQAKKIADLKKRVQKLEKAKEIKNYMLKKTKESDASKQGRSIEDIDKDADVSLVDDTQGSAAPITIKEITLAQTLIQIKAAKPKVVTTFATITTTTIPKARGVVVQEPSEFRTPQEPQPLMIKDKGKAIMIEPEVSLKRKDQVALDEDLARNLQAQLEAELIE
ncbi:hypothetical protein Tco_1214357 [Tanacetum coccineum]